MKGTRNVIRITADDSPNVKLARMQQSTGMIPTGTIICPGVLTWDEYQVRRATWDKVRQCVGLDAQFYRGAELLLFPPEWLNRAAELAVALVGRRRVATGIGIDPAEGGDRTTMCASDEIGVIELVSRQTPNTDDIPREAIAFMIRHQCPPERVAFDRGGGGQQHADRLRALRSLSYPQGIQVQTVGFGESLLLDYKRGLRRIEERRDNREERYTYKNRRAEMYGEASNLLDPGWTPEGYAIPRGTHADDPLTRLRKQLAVIPKYYDNEGRMFLPPKNRKPGEEPGGAKKLKTLVELIGHSPDEADAFVLSRYAATHRIIKNMAGPVVVGGAV